MSLWTAQELSGDSVERRQHGKALKELKGGGIVLPVVLTKPSGHWYWNLAGDLPCHKSSGPFARGFLLCCLIRCPRSFVQWNMHSWALVPAAVSVNEDLLDIARMGPPPLASLGFWPKARGSGSSTIH